MRDGLPEGQRASLLKLVRAGANGLFPDEFGGRSIRGKLARGGLARRVGLQWYATEMGMQWFGGRP